MNDLGRIETSTPNREKYANNGQQNERLDDPQDAIGSFGIFGHRYYQIVQAVVVLWRNSGSFTIL